MKHPSPVVTVRTELGAAVRFAVVVAATVVIGSVAVWNQGLSLIQTHITADAAHVVVAAFMPAFLGAWAFFLLRRVAWRSPGRAFVVGTAVGVAAHDRVFHSTYYRATDLDLPSAWMRGVFEGIVDPLWHADTGLLPVYLGTIVIVGLMAALLQRVVAAARLNR
jgi:hypothetical protein